MGAGISVEKLFENVTAQYERNGDGQKTRLKALLVRNPESGCLGRINIETDRMKADRKTSKLKKIDHTHKGKCHDTIKGETKPDKKKKKRRAAGSGLACFFGLLESCQALGGPQRRRH